MLRLWCLKLLNTLDDIYEREREEKNAPLQSIEFSVISTHLNETCDHLLTHDDFDHYRNAKTKYKDNFGQSLYLNTLC